ncbi:MAG: tail fiber protein [Vicinamibacteria bacterium]
MSQQFLAEIKIVGFNFAPRGWAFCNGQIMPISQNTALFSLLGTNYGGNGTTTFGLPDLQARAPLAWGSGPGLTSRAVGEQGGNGTVMLTAAQLPSHNHPMLGDNTGGGLAGPTGHTWGQPGARTPAPLYRSGAPNIAMSGTALAPTGGNGPHNNQSPYLALCFVIALQGIYPARN